jgi:hypothetical protein
MKPTPALPADPALPALDAIRATGLADALPALGLGDEPVELLLCGYTEGSRATLEARVGGRRFAIKAYAEDPTPEVELYQALAAAGLAGASGARVPPLLAWDRDLRVLVIGWLEGSPANYLIKNGQGRRAGELAARWLWRAASLPLKLGLPFGAGETLYQAGKSVAELSAADRALGIAAKAVAKTLSRAEPKEGVPSLLHGTLYARHVLDLGDGPGVIDWPRFGRGPVELDAGMFLATLSRLGLRHEAHATEVANAEAAFLGATRGLLDARALAWYRAASMLHLASRLLKREAPSEARVLVLDAERLAAQASGSDAVGPTARPVAKPPSLKLNGAGLELVLQALSTRAATPEEIERIRELLRKAKGENP